MIQFIWPMGMWGHYGLNGDVEKTIGAFNGSETTHTPLGNYDRQTNLSTNRLTDRLDRRKVTLPIRKICLYLLGFP